MSRVAFASQQGGRCTGVHEWGSCIHSFGSTSSCVIVCIGSRLGRLTSSRSSKEPRRSLPAPRRSTHGLVCALLVYRTPHVLTVAVTCVVLDAVRTWHELCENLKSLGWLHIAILLLFPSLLSFSLSLSLSLSPSLSLSFCFALSQCDLK